MTPARPLAVYTDVDDLDAAPGVETLMAAGLDVVVLETRDPDVILAAAAGATALLVGYAPVTAAMLEAMPVLRVISLLSMGSDGIDVPAATQRGIWVANITDVATAEVATHAWALTLSLVRCLPFFQTGAQTTTPDGADAGWLARPDRLPRRLSDLTVGLIGLGRIGTAFAAMAAGQVGSIIAHDPFVCDGSWPAGVQPAALDDVVATADILSLHVPLTDETRHLVNADLLSRLKFGSYLVNVSRGGLVDSTALAASLCAGHLAGAALDVLDVEPPPADHPLLGLPNVILTPHIGYLSDVTVRAYIDHQAANVVSWLQTGRPLTPVNAPAAGRSTA
ncbi:D-3-phosphoglycerate dehydrogenase [Nakamurella sp. UYEF19]|uniref:C-terminal binding protein n=1 Tax=Nakamurella sp. UYEF19 TaxID=1756392 RepID=UPI003397B8E4